MVFQICRLIIWLSPKVIPLQREFSRTRKVTAISRERNISANSIPIKPPTITALLVDGAHFSKASKSCLWYRPVTPCKSCPGQPYLLGLEPVELICQNLL
jgi:hypothetical protein